MILFVLLERPAVTTFCASGFFIPESYVLKRKYVTYFFNVCSM